MSLNIKYLLVFTSAFLIMKCQDSNPEIHPSLVGKQMEVLHDRLTRVKGDHPINGCYWFREYKVKFKYSGEEHKFIYYTIYQCLDEKKVL